jgi:hypothetical protein
LKFSGNLKRVFKKGPLDFVVCLWQHIKFKSPTPGNTPPPLWNHYTPVILTLQFFSLGFFTYATASGWVYEWLNSTLEWDKKRERAHQRDEKETTETKESAGKRERDSTQSAHTRQIITRIVHDLILVSHHILLFSRDSPSF